MISISCSSYFDSFCYEMWVAFQILFYRLLLHFFFQNRTLYFCAISSLDFSSSVSLESKWCNHTVVLIRLQLNKNNPREILTFFNRLWEITRICWQGWWACGDCLKLYHKGTSTRVLTFFKITLYIYKPLNVCFSLRVCICQWIQCV